MKLYGRTRTNDTIAANAYHDTFHDAELDGYLELIGIMVAPDLDPAGLTSNLNTLQLLVSDTEIPGIFPFKVNYYNNELPFAGIHPGTRPMCRFEPSLKIAKGREVALRLNADAVGVSNPYWVRPVGFLYKEDEVAEKFGLRDTKDFEAIEGGIAQGLDKVIPFIKSSTNKDATTAGEWYDLEDLTLKVLADEEIEITAVGCIAHTNQKELRFANRDKAIIGAEFPFATNANINELPWGCAWQDSGPYIFPESIRPRYRDDQMRVEIRDNGAVIPAKEALVYVRGTKRTGSRIGGA